MTRRRTDGRRKVATCSVTTETVSTRPSRAQGTLGAVRSGRPATGPKEVEIRALKAENEKLRRRVERSEAVIDVQKQLSALLGIDSERPIPAETMIAAAEQLAPVVGVSQACAATGVCRSTLYRRRKPKPAAAKTPRSRSARQLSEQEQQQVREVANSEQFRDQAPASIVATLLDEGRYHARSAPCTGSCRPTDRHGNAATSSPTPSTKPGLLVTAPKECWSWDITKLRGPVKWTCFYLMRSTTAAVSRPRVCEGSTRTCGEPHRLRTHSARSSATRSYVSIPWVAGRS